MDNYGPWAQTSGQNSGQGMDLLSLLMGRQPSAAQSVAGGLPFLRLPGQQQRYMQPAQNAADAMTDINNPLYQQIYGQQQQQGQQNLAQSIQQLSMQNRKLSSMGRVPLFDPERGGEQLFRGLTSGYQDVQNQAATNTRGILGNSFANNLALGNQRTQLAQNKAGIQGNLLGALTKLFGL